MDCESIRTISLHFGVCLPMNFTRIVCHQFLLARVDGLTIGEGLYGSSGIKLSPPAGVSNQFISRHSRSAIRARCNITQSLLSLMERIAQTSLLGTPSISRMVKTARIFSGSLKRQ